MIKSFISGIVGVVFLAVACEMIMPEGCMKKYIRLAMGFVMISVMISPFIKGAKLPEFEFEFDSAYTEEELTAQSNAYILMYHRKNIEKRAREICGEGAKAYAEVNSDGSVKSIRIESENNIENKRAELVKEFGCENIIISGGGDDENQY